MKINAKLILTCSLLILTNTVFSQSTSNWIKVKSTMDDSQPEAIKKGASYVTISVVNSKIFHQSNWWSGLVGKNKKAFYAISVSATYPNNVNLSNRWSSEQVTIEKQQIPIEIGWSQTLANELPTTFTSLKVNITLGYNSVDGIDKVIGIVSEISKTVPPLASIQTYASAVSGTKMILDELFNKKLAASYLNSNNELMPSSQNRLDAGYYVIFGEKSSEAYQKYKSAADKLVWNTHDLLFNEQPINDVNYVVILLEAKSKLFPVKDINMLTNTDISWVKFYMKSNTVIDNWSSLINQNNIIKGVRENIAAAKALLDNDPTYIFSEKEEIHNFLETYLFAKLDKRKTDLVANPGYYKNLSN